MAHDFKKFSNVWVSIHQHHAVINYRFQYMEIAEPVKKRHIQIVQFRFFPQSMDNAKAVIQMEFSCRINGDIDIA